MLRDHLQRGGERTLHDEEAVVRTTHSACVLSEEVMDKSRATVRDFYGHAAESFNEKADHRGNAYWFQALRANELFKALDGKQREIALLDKPRPERGNETVKLTGKTRGLPGIPVTDLSSDQKDLVRKVMADLLAPFRKADSDEAMKLVQANGFNNLHMAFYKGMDIGDDGVWDVWQIEGPAMIWYFRGSPHVHTWVHIRRDAKSA